MGRAMPEVLGRSKNFIMWLDPFGRKKGRKLLAMVGCNGNVIRSAHIPCQISLQTGLLGVGRLPLASNSSSDSNPVLSETLQSDWSPSLVSGSFRAPANVASVMGSPL